MLKLLILDRDGVINYDSDAYIKSVEEWIPLPGSVEAIAQLSKAGWTVAIATNQSGIARGYYDIATLDAMHARLRALVAEQGGEVGLVVYCPHGPDEGCDCRKPKPGMLKIIAEHYKVPLAGIWFVGTLLFIGAVLFNPESSNSVQAPAFIGGIGGIMAVIVMVPFMFVGFDVIPQAAEEIDLTRPNIGKFLIISIIVAVMWYVGIAWSVGTTLPLVQAESSTLATADAMTNAWQGKWAGILLVIGGVLGILSSWNAFLIGGSRLLYAMSRAHMLPAFLGKLHPKYKTPSNAILLIGGLATLAPLFGRKMLVWIVDAGGFGIVIAYTCVAISFLVLRYREPDMVRPFRIPAGKLVGMLTIVLSFGLLMLYMPGMPSALTAVEWWIFFGWTVLGIVLYSYARIKYPGISEAIMAEELRELKIVNQLWLKDNPKK